MHTDINGNRFKSSIPLDLKISKIRKLCDILVLVWQPLLKQFITNQYTKCSKPTEYRIQSYTKRKGVMKLDELGNFWWFKNMPTSGAVI